MPRKRREMVRGCRRGRPSRKDFFTIPQQHRREPTKGATMSDLVEAPITDEALAQAISAKARRLHNEVAVLQLILDHVPKDTCRVQWSGQQDYYRNIPQAMRGR